MGLSSLFQVVLSIPKILKLIFDILKMISDSKKAIEDKKKSDTEEKLIKAKKEKEIRDAFEDYLGRN